MRKAELTITIGIALKDAQGYRTDNVEATCTRPLDILDDEEPGILVSDAVNGALRAIANGGMQEIEA